MSGNGQQETSPHAQVVADARKLAQIVCGVLERVEGSDEIELTEVGQALDFRAHHTAADPASCESQTRFEGIRSTISAPV